ADQSQLQADKIRTDSANPPPLTLMAFQESADGLTKPLDHLLVGGETTIFKMASVKPVVVALAVSEDQQAPTVVFKDARIPPGPERLVAKFAGPFQYTATPEPHDVRVCLLAGADQQELDNQVAHLAEIWATLPAHRCVQLRRK
ncbi:MAG: hypothetical protein OEW58_13210, partial [Gammaproteobacteria bacterium]|nr:hypothetical protein [Gammaproteobacteria bacterium]